MFSLSSYVILKISNVFRASSYRRNRLRSSKPINLQNKQRASIKVCNFQLSVLLLTWNPHFIIAPTPFSIIIIFLCHDDRCSGLDLQTSKLCFVANIDWLTWLGSWQNFNQILLVERINDLLAVHAHVKPSR